MATKPLPFIADSRATVIVRRGHLGNRECPEHVLCARARGDLVRALSAFPSTHGRPDIRRPRDYDLEHENDEDVAFYIDLVLRLRPRRVLELGAGSGRVTIPLAERAA